MGTSSIPISSLLPPYLFLILQLLAGIPSLLDGNPNVPSLTPFGHLLRIGYLLFASISVAQ